MADLTHTNIYIAYVWFIEHLYSESARTEGRMNGIVGPLYGISVAHECLCPTRVLMPHTSAYVPHTSANAPH